MKSTEWSRDRAAIPNLAGYPIMVITTSGSTVETEVEIVDGVHRLRGIEIAEVHAWRRRREAMS